MTSDSSRPRRRCLWVLPLIVALLVLAYALAGFHGVPRLAKSIAREQATRLGAQLAIGEITFNPFTFEARIAALQLDDAQGAPLAGFERLYVDADVVKSVRQRGVVLRVVNWTAPDVSLVVEKDGSLNFSKLVPPRSEPETPKPKRATPRVRVGEFTIERGRVGIEDRSRPQPFSVELTPLEFSLKQFSTDPDYRNAYAFSGVASTGEELQWTGDFTVQPIGSHGKFMLKNLKASTITAYLQDQLPVRLVSGVAELGGDYQLAFDPALSLELAVPTATVRDIALAEPGNRKAAPLVTLAELGVKGFKLSLEKRTVALERIALKGLSAAIIRERDGSLNLRRLYEPRPAGAKNAAPAWSVAVKRVDLAHSAAKVEDRGVEPALQLELKPIAASVTGFSTDPAALLKIAASVGLDGGEMSAQGELALKPLAAKFALDAKGLDLSLLQPYLATRTGLGLRSGTLAAVGDLSYATSAETPPKIAFTGEAGISKLKLEDRALKQELLRWGELRVSGIDYRNTPPKLDIERIELSEPYARVVISEDREINIRRALAAPGAPSPPPPTDASMAEAQQQKKRADDAMPVRIKSIRVDKGQMRFTDLSIEPRFSAGIFALDGDITGLSTEPSTRTKIHLEGKVDEFAPVLIDGEIIPTGFGQYTDIAMSFRNMDLIRFNPYSGRFAGYNIVKGKLTTELKYKIVERQLEAEHHVVLDQLEFGDATGSKDAVPLPVKLAVALLKDRHGVIDLGMPVRGSLDDPTFRVGPLVWKVFVNLLSKAVTSPFAALGRLFGGGEELAYVDFAPGASELSAEESEKLSTLGKALAERPQLKLDIPLAKAAVQDGDALARRVMSERVPAVVDPAITAENAAKQRLRALENLHKELLGADPAYPDTVDALEGEAKLAARIAFLEPALLAKLAPEPRALDRLASQRARSVQGALLANGEIQPERIFLTSRDTTAISEAGAVRMELKLQ